jgi:hypothetical protein
MKTRLYLSLTLLASISILFISCDPIVEEDSCEIFDVIEEIAPQCEIPSVCPPDENSDSYYILALDGTKYLCDPETASNSNPNGCNEATSTFIDEKCGEGVTAEQRIEIIMQMNVHTQALMERVRINSICL